MPRSFDNGITNIPCGGAETTTQAHRYGDDRIIHGSVRPRLTRKACSPKTRLFDCAERSNKRVEISLLQRQIDDSVQMCKQAFF